MAEYRLARLARNDWAEIIDYTVDTWGEEQARRYNRGLTECLDRLAMTPRIGRRCDSIHLGYRRFEHEKHVIFYRIDDESIFVIRILHQRMLPAKHLFDGLEIES